jgi:hypothetical protein
MLAWMHSLMSYAYGAKGDGTVSFDPLIRMEIGRMHMAYDANVSSPTKSIYIACRHVIYPQHDPQGLSKTDAINHLFFLFVNYRLAYAVHQVETAD